MSGDVLKGQWKQVRGHAKEWWGKLTDDDLDKVDGKFDRFVGVIQERYGLAKEKAAAEIVRRLDSLQGCDDEKTSHRTKGEA